MEHEKQVRKFNRWANAQIKASGTCTVEHKGEKFYIERERPKQYVCWRDSDHSMESVAETPYIALTDLA